MPPKCQYCGNYHEQICPLIKQIEYHDNGTIKLISFWSAATSVPLISSGESQKTNYE